MSAFEVAALVGAAAWVPQIVLWAHRWLAKPKLKLLAATIPEVGYSTLGPIMNIRFSISTSRKAAVIERMELVISHERGQSVELAWATLDETVSQVRSTTGETAEVKRQQPAIALKVSTDILAERLIGFQDRAYEQEQRQLINAVQDKVNHLRRTEEDYRELVLRSEVFANLVAFYKTWFPWQEGRYEVVVSTYMSGVKSAATERFTFTLTADTVERLKGNIGIIENVAREIASEVPYEERTPLDFYWANPPLAPVEEPRLLSRWR